MFPMGRAKSQVCQYKILYSCLTVFIEVPCLSLNFPAFGIWSLHFCLRDALESNFCSSFGQGLQTSTNPWENIFAICITACGVWLLVILVGKIQVCVFIFLVSQPESSKFDQFGPCETDLYKIWIYIGGHETEGKRTRAVATVQKAFPKSSTAD